MRSLEDENAHRLRMLIDAQEKATELFALVAQDIIRPGITEQAMSDEINALAHARFGVVDHWHKRIVRSGPNTLLPYVAMPPDRMIEADDILFLDLGPVFERWEADFGRTFVLGNDPHKLQLAAALDPVWNAVKAHYDTDPDITGGALYDVACRITRDHGFEFGGTIAGHLIGEFPHEHIPQDRETFYIASGNATTLSALDELGRKRHWILEIHLVDRERQIGAFCEALLTV